MFNAHITLEPSFDLEHVWQVIQRGEVFLIKGSTGRASASLEKQLSEAEHVIFSAAYSEDIQTGLGLDGFFADFDIQLATSTCKVRLWNPDQNTAPSFHGLLAFCWRALYGQNAEYDKCLEMVFGYLWEKTLPATQKGSTLKIFGHVSTSNTTELIKAFAELGKLPNPTVDMTNFLGIGSALFPILIEFAKAHPEMKWVANQRAAKQLDEMGIAYCSV